MAMFTRRALQRMLDHLAAHLPLEAREKLAHEMNRQTGSPLGYEWEAALLFGFSHIGKIEYEAPTSTGSHPDITFAEASNTPISFTADIATVSDEGLEDENPTARFSIALSRLRQKYKLSGSTHFNIKGEATGPQFRDRKMRLKLPAGGHQVEKMLEKHLAPMFKRIREENLPTASIAINEAGVEVTVRYNANQRYGGGSYPSYTSRLFAHTQSGSPKAQGKTRATQEIEIRESSRYLSLRWRVRAFASHTEVPYHHRHSGSHRRVLPPKLLAKLCRHTYFSAVLDRHLRRRRQGVADYRPSVHQCTRQERAR